MRLKSTIPIIEPDDKQQIKPGVAYLAPSNYHMYAELGNTIALSTEGMVKYSRPSIDLTFESASNAFRDKLVGIIVSGANTDGAEGIKKVKERGGYTIVQEPSEATISTMPNGALKIAKIDKVLKIDEIIKFLVAIN